MKKLFIIFFVFLNLNCFADECEKFIENLPADSIHGYVKVPEDWSKPRKSKKIDVFYHGYNFTFENRDIPPVVYFNGGPGSYARGLHGWILKDPERAKHYQKIPFIFIDQRGNGCSSSLPTFEKVNNKAIKRMSHYGARSIVFDSEAVRESLGFEKWRIFGQGFGSFIVHRYLELRPHAVKAAYAHGMSIMTDGIVWTAERVKAFKRLGDMYFDIYPKDRKILNRVKAIFPKDYCSGNEMFKVCGKALLDKIGWRRLSYKSFGRWEKMHEEIKSLLDERQNLNMDVIKKLFPAEAKLKKETFLLVDVVLAREAPGGFLNTWSCEKAMPLLRKQGIDVDAFDFNECRHALEIQRRFNYKKIKKIVREDFVSLSLIRQNLKEREDLPFYLYSAELDFFGPEGSFEQEVDYLKGLVNYTAFKNSDHGQFFIEMQVWRDLLATN